MSMSIAKKETRAVNVWRYFMMAVLVSCTVGVAVGVYFFVNASEVYQFEISFEDDSGIMYEAIGNQFDAKLGAVDAFAVAAVSFARAANMTWPFVVTPDFAVRASKVRSISQAIWVQQFQYVDDRQRKEWENFSSTHDSWVQDAIQIRRGDVTFLGKQDVHDYVPTNVSTEIQYDGIPTKPNSGPYLPNWETYPVVPEPGEVPYNWNARQNPGLRRALDEAIGHQRVVISKVINLDESSLDTKWTNEFFSRLVGPNVDVTEPLVSFLYPILDKAADESSTASPNSSVVGVIATTFFWGSFLTEVLPENERGLVVVFSNECNQSITYQVNGPEVEYLGPGDLHDTKYDGIGQSIALPDLSSHNSDGNIYTGLTLLDHFCTYTVTTYPSEEMENIYRTSDPIIFSLAAASIFIFTAFVFLAYDKLVNVRQQKVMKSAQKSNAIVSSLFPSNIRDRLLEDSEDNMFQPTKTKLKSFLNDGRYSDGESVGGIPQSKPIADLFTDCTVMFADIANFTAWSSVREPGQVFTLLETVYGAFDQIAVRRGVFKVETIGDSYVCVTGLPEPRADHAVAMVRFARDCRDRFKEVTAKLEVSLGPETADLSLRIGLHSGPVTAGVLRGQKSRFQLFGDTVNTAARMESTGVVNMIHISQTTANLLIEGHKSNWLKPRRDKVEAKGKGMMQTYWVEPKRAPTISVAGSDENAKLVSMYGLDKKLERLVNWNTDVLCRLLSKIQLRRNLKMQLTKTKSSFKVGPDVVWSQMKNCMVLEEVKEVVELPDFDPTCHADEDEVSGYNDAILNDNVRSQLRDYVTAIAVSYRNNDFHNFEHASHVCMSVAKLLSRIVAADQVLNRADHPAKIASNHLASDLHDHTYGITSDPLTQFACIYAALIHDVDHPGVCNAQLVREGHDLSKVYKGKSVAEQNSVNVAWALLMEGRFVDLRRAICETQDEEVRFRQLVVNTVMATDIMDKDLKRLREERWQVAFADQGRRDGESFRTSVNRKATIVIEHLIQASDVAHTMQHWHIYRKWNERLFNEMYQAFLDGRSTTDPTDFWYDGELSFFDFYIIPLAKKLSECGVFGVSSGEYLNYAVLNRSEWEKKGKSVVAGYVRKIKNIDDDGEGMVSTSLDLTTEEVTPV